MLREQRRGVGIKPARAVHPDQLYVSLSAQLLYRRSIFSDRNCMKPHGQSSLGRPLLRTRRLARSIWPPIEVAFSKPKLGDRWHTANAWTREEHHVVRAVFATHGPDPAYRRGSGRGSKPFCVRSLVPARMLLRSGLRSGRASGAVTERRLARDLKARHHHRAWNASETGVERPPDAHLHAAGRVRKKNAPDLRVYSTSNVGTANAPDACAPPGREHDRVWPSGSAIREGPLVTGFEAQLAFVGSAGAAALISCSPSRSAAATDSVSSIRTATSA